MSPTCHMSYLSYDPSFLPGVLFEKNLWNGWIEMQGAGSRSYWGLRARCCLPWNPEATCPLGHHEGMEYSKLSKDNGLKRKEQLSVGSQILQLTKYQWEHVLIGGHTFLWINHVCNGASTLQDRWSQWDDPSAILTCGLPLMVITHEPSQEPLLSWGHLGWQTTF